MQAGGDDAHGGVVPVLETAARLVRAGQGGLAGIEDGLVDAGLNLGETAVDGQRARDVGRVQGVNLDTCVDEHQVALTHLAVIVDPVQGVRVVARGRDGLVALAVALLAGDGRERALDDALAATVAHGAGQDADDVLEAGLGDLDRANHLVELESILDETDFGEALLETLVVLAGLLTCRQPGLGAHLVDHRLDVSINAAHDAQLNGPGVLRQHVAQRVDVAGLQTGLRAQLLERGARAHPEFAVAGVRVKLLGRTRGAGLEKEQGSVGAVLVRLQHQDGVRLLLAAQARQVREGGVRAETVVAVVGADLVGARGHDEALAREGGAGLEGAVGHEVGDALALGQFGGAGPPSGADEIAEGGGLGLTGAVFAAIGHGLGGFFTHGHYSTAPRPPGRIRWS